jgi:hypothetical protein
VEEYSGRYTDALRVLALAAKVWESFHDERLDELARNMERRAELFEQLRRKKEAVWLRERIAELAVPASKIETAGTI